MMGAQALAGAIRSRKLSCVEVMSAYLDHIDAVNPKVNAIVALQERADLVAQARERDAQLARGEAVGPLHGLPHAVKDLAPVRGIRTTMGSPILKDNVPAADSAMVERLRRAGVIFIGKTNTPEFGLGSNTFNPVHGITRNAYDQSRSAGGSSGGAAVALALRMLPLADGTDYAGSLRNPAGWNNVFGFRTSLGLVPADGRDPFLLTMGVIGPMARSVTDLALLLSVQAGYDARVPLSIAGDGAAFRAPLERDFKGTRIAWTGDYGGHMPYEPGVLDLCKSALKTFESDGVHRRGGTAGILHGGAVAGVPAAAGLADRGAAAASLPRPGTACAVEARGPVRDRARAETVGARYHGGFGGAGRMVPGDTEILRDL